jgi:starch synthase
MVAALGESPRVLLASAECAPLVKVGGLGEATQGLVGALRRLGADVDLVLPDYGWLPVAPSLREPLEVPDWAGPASVGRTLVPGLGRVSLLHVPGIERPHPYVDPSTGQAWPDNDRRFFAFAAAVAALADRDGAEVVHLNDWHTALAAGLLPGGVRTVLALHNLAYQGQADPGWVEVLDPARRAPFLRGGACNPLAGALALADRVVTVSPRYAQEIRSEPGGVGLADVVNRRAASLSGIRNGIDEDLWDPTSDPYLPAPFSASDLSGKAVARKALLAETPLQDNGEPIIGLVARLVDQKGVDLALDLAPFLARMGAKLVLIGDGESTLVARAARVAGSHRERMFFFARYQEDLAHLVVVGSDLLLAPSRFEPCGLVQMQAMNVGTIPVVTGVGGLADTVIDADADPVHGTGFVADTADPLHLLDALHRSVRAVSDPERLARLQHRGMRSDWSWRRPAEAYLELYRQVTGADARLDRAFALAAG